MLTPTRKLFQGPPHFSRSQVARKSLPLRRFFERAGKKAKLSSLRKTWRAAPLRNDGRSCCRCSSFAFVCVPPRLPSLSLSRSLPLSLPHKINFMSAPLASPAIYMSLQMCQAAETHCHDGCLIDGFFRAGIPMQLPRAPANQGSEAGGKN